VPEGVASIAERRLGTRGLRSARRLVLAWSTTASPPRRPNPAGWRRLTQRW